MIFLENYAPAKIKNSTDVTKITFQFFFSDGELYQYIKSKIIKNNSHKSQKFTQKTPKLTRSPKMTKSLNFFRSVVANDAGVRKLEEPDREALILAIS